MDEIHYFFVIPSWAWRPSRHRIRRVSTGLEGLIDDAATARRLGVRAVIGESIHKEVLRALVE